MKLSDRDKLPYHTPPTPDLLLEDDPDDRMKVLGYYRGCMLVEGGVSKGEVEVYSPRQASAEESHTTRYILGTADSIDDAKSLVDEQFGHLAKRDIFGMGVPLELT